MATAKTDLDRAMAETLALILQAARDRERALAELARVQWVQDGWGWRPRDPYFDGPKSNH